MLKIQKVEDKKSFTYVTTIDNNIDTIDKGEIYKVHLDESHPTTDVTTHYYHINNSCIEDGYIKQINNDDTFLLNNGQIENMKDWDYVNIYHGGTLYYEGLIKNGKKNGFGKEYFNKDEFYIGEFLDNKANGKGKYVDSSTETIGIFKNGFLNGYAEYFDKNNNFSYKGYWVDGFLNGKGEIQFLNNETYDGSLKDDKFHGFGVFTDYEGNLYSGDWNLDIKEGEGTFIYSDGRKYKGNFKNNQKDGYGEYYWTDGDIYKGFWKNGKRHGKGTKIKGNEKKEVVYRFNKKISEKIIKN
jgi:hypothetical protein